MFERILWVLAYTGAWVVAGIGSSAWAAEIVYVNGPQSPAHILAAVLVGVVFFALFGILLSLFIKAIQEIK